MPPYRILIRRFESTFAPVGPAIAELTEVHARCVGALYVTLCVTTLLRIHLVDPWIAEESSSSRWTCPLREAPGEILYGNMVGTVSNLEFGQGLIMLHCHHIRICLAGLETAAYNGEILYGNMVGTVSNLDSDVYHFSRTHMRAAGKDTFLRMSVYSLPIGRTGSCWP